MPFNMSYFNSNLVTFNEDDSGFSFHNLILLPLALDDPR
jgi:hypothetical protein